MLEALERGRDLAAGSGPWTVKLLEQADAELGPEWWDVTLTGAEAAAVVLPRHAGEPCHGDTMTLVGDAGLTPAEAAARFAAGEDACTPAPTPRAGDASIARAASQSPASSWPSRRSITRSIAA